MSEPVILIVEDEAPIREMLRVPLVRAGFSLLEAEDTRQAQNLIYEQRPDLILLDWMLPETSGLEFARRLKKDVMYKEIPIIILTARSEENDKVRGLDVGADDYVTKPFSPRELTARIKAVLRRAAFSHEAEHVSLGGVTLLPQEHRVSCEDKEISMGPTEFRLLHFFMTHPDRVYSRGQLIDQVWGGNVYIEERTVDVHIRRLRKALAVCGRENLVQTVRSVGYRFSIH